MGPTSKCSGATIHFEGKKTGDEFPKNIKTCSRPYKPRCILWPTGTLPNMFQTIVYHLKYTAILATHCNALVSTNISYMSTKMKKNTANCAISMLGKCQCSKIFSL